MGMGKKRERWSAGGVEMGWKSRIGEVEVEVEVEGRVGPSKRREGEAILLIGGVSRVGEGHPRVLICSGGPLKMRGKSVQKKRRRWFHRDWEIAKGGEQRWGREGLGVGSREQAVMKGGGAEIEGGGGGRIGDEEWGIESGERAECVLGENHSVWQVRRECSGEALQVFGFCLTNQVNRRR
ncbi:hypothetical protein AMTR_s00036p00146650 [Amborella trichopoda]|uniref:Uncharacterized protein n=1 Tax=Amborella trichopoda TaxID=13333 RepID=U5CYV1_AMBTC|nr:hypothetical protein AMTR_s00036p00146650 [Amborella trichopoda]